MQIEYIWTVPPGVSIVSVKLQQPSGVLFDNTYQVWNYDQGVWDHVPSANPSVITVRRYCLLYWPDLVRPVFVKDQAKT